MIVRSSPSASSKTPDSDTSCVPLSLVIVASSMALSTVGASLGGPTGVVCTPLVRTHWLEFPSRSLMLLRWPTMERMNTPVATPFFRSVMVKVVTPGSTEKPSFLPTARGSRGLAHTPNSWLQRSTCQISESSCPSREEMFHVTVSVPSPGTTLMFHGSGPSGGSSLSSMVTVVVPVLPGSTAHSGSPTCVSVTVKLSSSSTASSSTVGTAMVALRCPSGTVTVETISPMSPAVVPSSASPASSNAVVTLNVTPPLVAGLPRLTVTVASSPSVTLASGFTLNVRGGGSMITRCVWNWSPLLTRTQT